MLELKRIYWTRLLLRLAKAALTVWILAAAILSLVARSGNVAAGGRPNTVTAVFSGMFDGVLAAVALPGILVTCGIRPELHPDDVSSPFDTP